VGAAAGAAGHPRLEVVLSALRPIFERPRALLEAPRLAADGAVLFSDVTGGGVCRNGEPIVPRGRGIGGLVEHRDGAS
jgi:hypothetical protein